MYKIAELISVSVFMLFLSALGTSQEHVMRLFVVVVGILVDGGKQQATI